MTWYNKLQFCTMVLAVVGVAIDWHVGLWATIAFGAASIVALIGQLTDGQRLGNHSLRPQLKVGLVAMLAYWLLLLASVLYSADIDTANKLLTLKGTFLVFPISLLLTDTSWLGTKHLRTLGYALAVTLLCSFLYYSGVSVSKLINGTSLSSIITGGQFDPHHHAYTALYLSVAMLFVYHELHTRWDTLPRWWLVLLIVSAPLFILYNIIVNSRAGMLTMYAIELFCVLHFAMTRRRWGWAVLLAVLLAGYTIGMEHAMPGYANRVTTTISNMSGDVRMDIYKNDLDAAMESPIVGYGAGDYREELKQQYSENDFESGVNAGFNAHNQYFETALSIGIIGLAVMLLWLLWPLWRAWRSLCNGDIGTTVFWMVPMLTFCMAFNFMFESMLERQMGLLFVGALIPIMLLIINTEQNKFGQLPKK